MEKKTVREKGVYENKAFKDRLVWSHEICPEDMPCLSRIMFRFIIQCVENVFCSAHCNMTSHIFRAPRERKGGRRNQEWKMNSESIKSLALLISAFHSFHDPEWYISAFIGPMFVLEYSTFTNKKSKTFDFWDWTVYIFLTLITGLRDNWWQQLLLLRLSIT